MSNGDINVVHPTPVTAWQLIAGVVAVMVTMAMALWTIISAENANNASIIKELREGYTTRIQHDDLIRRFEREVTRVDSVTNKIDNDMLLRREFDRWKLERDLRLDVMKDDINKMKDGHVSRREFDGVLAERGRQIDALKRDVDTMRDIEEKRHTIITDQLHRLPSSTSK